MTTKQTMRRPAQPPKEIIGGKETCANGHKWESNTTRWRLRDRTGRKDKKGSIGWERDCLVCREVAKGRQGSGLRSQSWIPGGTK